MKPDEQVLGLVKWDNSYPNFVIKREALFFYFNFAFKN
jgi:hypothetical protein